MILILTKEFSKLNFSLFQLFRLFFINNLQTAYAKLVHYASEALGALPRNDIKIVSPSILDNKKLLADVKR